MKSLGAILVTGIAILMWVLVTFGGALQDAYEWVRRCPVCHRTLRKQDPRERFHCQTCGWQE